MYTSDVQDDPERWREGGPRPLWNEWSGNSLYLFFFGFKLWFHLQLVIFFCIFCSFFFVSAISFSLCHSTLILIIFPCFFLFLLSLCTFLKFDLFLHFLFILSFFLFLFSTVSLPASFLFWTARLLNWRVCGKRLTCFTGPSHLTWISQRRYHVEQLLPAIYLSKCWVEAKICME